MISSLAISALAVNAVITSALPTQTRVDADSGLTWIFKDSSLPKVMSVRWDL